MTPWKRIHIPHPKRKYPNPLVHESMVSLRNYTGTLRQVVIRNNSRETSAFLVTNDFDMPLELIVGNYARRWRVEDVACGYKGLMVIERCFRSLKRTQIKMTPVFHWAPHRAYCRDQLR